MATGGLDVGIELEQPPTPRGHSRRTIAAPLAPSTNAAIASEQRSHSRSASWSFTRGQMLNPISPITSVLTGIVPSLSQISMSAGNAATSHSIPESPPPSRTSSRETLLVRGGSSAGASSGDGSGERGEEAGRREESFNSDSPRLSPNLWDSRTVGDSSTNVSVHVPRGHNPSTTGGIQHQNGNEEQNVGVDIGDGVRWLERNAIFIILLLVKFAWYHRSGENSPLTEEERERERERERDMFNIKYDLL